MVSDNTNSFTSSENVETWRQVLNATELLNSILESADNTTDSIVASIDTSANYTETQSQTNNGAREQFDNGITTDMIYSIDAV